MMDSVGNKAARQEIAMIKVITPQAGFGQVPKTHRSKTLSHRMRKKGGGPFERPRKGS
jgi:hypothetical protein